ncbi:MAG: Asp-tRNA(Asn)/Glu-tRNA(Gln) amidotransferase subunit GatA [Planctomycetes bacterium]|nr:Asp-tRNA(Asn)/Glu-tRNA(Gln) amidotransferase subunit GatA [Planctomycetota bacterium]
MSDHQTISELTAAVRSGRTTASDAVAGCLQRIDTHDRVLNCFRETWPEAALASAREIDRRIAAGEDPGPLAGVPIAIKDNIATTTGTTACGSRMLESYRSPFAATAVRRLVDAGAVPIGKTNCDEFAMGSSTEHCAFGATRNPWDPDRVPGGSSGGSAAAVAAGLCPVALGSDTGGSIRQPAAMCGIVGVKPSYGRVSRYGLVAFGSSLDQIGPLTGCVADAALLLGVIAGRDRHDSTSSDHAVPDYLEGLDEPVAGLRLGVPKQYADPANDESVNRALDEACEVYRDLGAEIVEVDLPLTRYGVATYYVIAPAEASSNLARYDGIRYGRRATLAAGENLDDLYARSRAEGFGPEVQRRIMIGTYALSAGYYDAYYGRALQVRRLISEEYDRAFAKCDAIIGPTSPIPAFRLGEKADPLTMYLCDVYTLNTNIAGICAISLPGGFAETDGATLPVGIQIQCPAFDETRLFRIARMHERAVTHGRRRPDLAGAAGNGS